MKSINSSPFTLAVGFALLLSSSMVFAQSKPLEPIWSRPDVDFKQYTRFLIKPLNVSDVKVQRPPWAENDPIDWNLEMMNKSALQAMFHSAMKDVLEADDGYPIVYETGDDVLEVNVELLSIMPYVRPGSGGKDGEHEVISLGSGEVMASASLRDSQSRALLILLEGERVVGDDYKQATRENSIINLQGMFLTFAKRLRFAMDKSHGK
jgi:hypothetical protein